MVELAMKKLEHPIRMKYHSCRIAGTALSEVRRHFRLLTWVPLVCLFLFSFASRSALARTIFVTNTTDNGQVNSLRGAVMKANESRQPTTIVLSLDEYDLGTNDEIVVTGNVEVVGESAGSTIAATDYAARIFLVQRGAVLTLVNVTLTGGSAQQGGAIYNGGTLHMRDCIIAENVSVPVFSS
jgi:hypothetical protein